MPDEALFLFVFICFSFNTFALQPGFIFSRWTGFDYAVHFFMSPPLLLQ